MKKTLCAVFLALVMALTLCGVQATYPGEIVAPADFVLYPGTCVHQTDYVILFPQVNGATIYHYLVKDNGTLITETDLFPCDEMQVIVPSYQVKGGHKLAVTVQAQDASLQVLAEQVCEGTVSCPHTATSENVTKTTYDKVNSVTHIRHETYDVVCDVCKAVINSGLTRDYPEGHTVGTGKCAACGYVDVTLSADRSSTYTGQSVMFTVQSSVSSGTAELMIGDRVLTSGLLYNGMAQLNWVFPSSGTYSVVARVDGNDSSPLKIKVTAPYGTLPAPGLSVSSSVYTLNDISLRFNSVNGAQTYQVRVYDGKGNTVYSSDVNSTGRSSYSVVVSGNTVKKPGQWTVEVTAAAPGFDPGTARSNVTVRCSHYKTGEKTNTKYEDYGENWHKHTVTVTEKCSVCGVTLSVETPVDALEEHTGPICSLCGHIQEGYAFIVSAELAPVDRSVPGGKFTVTVVTDPLVTDISARNNSGSLMANTWTKTRNADGTTKWVRVYTSDKKDQVYGRYWTITAKAGKVTVATMDTNALDIVKNAPAKTAAPTPTPTPAAESDDDLTVVYNRAREDFRQTMLTRTEDSALRKLGIAGNTKALEAALDLLLDPNGAAAAASLSSRDPVALAYRYFTENHPFTQTLSGADALANRTLADICGGLTNHQLPEPYGELSGHCTKTSGRNPVYDYWYNSVGGVYTTVNHDPATVLWADYYTAVLTGDKTTLLSLEGAFPTACQKMAEMAKKVGGR